MSAAFGLALVAAACSSTSSTSTGSSAAPSSTAAAPAGSAASSGGSGSSGSTPAGAVAKVSANTATDDQIQKALEAAGVPNAARWTREVTEYRPYPTDDPSLAKLKKELQKYNPSADTLSKILAALQP